MPENRLNLNAGFHQGSDPDRSRFDEVLSVPSLQDNGTLRLVHDSLAWLVLFIRDCSGFQSSGLDASGDASCCEFSLGIAIFDCTS